MKKVSVIIPNYNGRDLLAKNLSGVISAANYSKNRIMEVIVVDDDSKDASCEFIKDKYPEIRLIKHSQNRGFAASVNTGVRSAKAELVCLLNSDVMPDRDFLEHVLANFKDANVFAVSLHEAGYGWGKAYFKNGFVELAPGAETASIHDTFWASGGSAIFARTLWIKVGGMDEILFSPFYWEDIDLSYRAAKRGYKVLWDPAGKVVHEHEATVKKANARYVAKIRQRNQILFIWKNITSQTLFRRHIKGLIIRIARHPGYILILVSALSKLFSARRARKREKKSAKVSDEAIFARFK